MAIAQPKLPEEVKRQGVKTEKRSTNIVLMVNLVSPDGTLRRNLHQQLHHHPDQGRAGPGPASARSGHGGQGLRDADLARSRPLKARDLTTIDVVDAIREQNVQVAAGQIGGQPAPPDQHFQYTVNTLGRLRDVEQFENMIVKVASRASWCG